MWYLASKLFWAVGRPSAFLLLLVLVSALLLMRTRHSRLGFALLAAGAAGLAACALLPVGTWLMRPLEERFPQFTPTSDHVDGIILLGGEIDIRTSIDRGMPALNARAERIIAFVALARRYPHARLVFTGGDASLFAKTGTEAGIFRIIVSELGVPLRRVIFEQASRNTRENAVLSRLSAHPKPGERWLLVTSAADMPRAIGCFRAAGWPVIAVPVDFHTEHYADEWAPGLLPGLFTVDWAVHEWLGLLYYRFRGWTGSLFPGPAA